MESKGGCCIARYEAASGVYYDMSNVNRIMLRFRPIAPKPPSTGGGSVSPRDGSTGQVYSKPVKGKKRHVKESNTKRKKRVSSEEKMVTLPLISETPDCCKDSVFKEKKEESLSFLGGGSSSNSSGGESDDRSTKVVLVGSGSGSSSCVTVECVTDPWVSGDRLGCTDEERKVNLGKDTCPGFISDAMGTVTWTNRAYKEMVGGGDTTTVRLMMKQRLPPVMTFPAFTCRVRVQYICGKDTNSLTLPCDVWRMNGGGFAWRLDIAAALCLGR